MAPHRALGIAEVVGLVFEELQNDNNSLAVCARTCKSFSEPALNVLWRHLDSMAALRGILPPSMGEKTNWEDVDWIRFDLYAKRVRILGVSDGGANEYKVQKLCAMHVYLAKYRQGCDLFPSLHKLGVSGINQFILSMRFPRSLHTLEVRFGQKEFDSNSGGLYILSAVTQIPSLENLILTGTVNPMTLVHIASFGQLRCLDLLGVRLSPSLRTIVQDGLRALFGMETLIKLILPRTPGVLEVADIPGGIVSRSLKTIDIYGNSSFLCRVISLLSSTATHTVTIRAQNTTPDDEQVSTEQWRGGLDQLRAHCGSSLRCVVFHPSTLDRGSHSFQVLQPLLELHHLEEFQTSGALVVSVNDITAMATAWPNIHGLKLGVSICPPANDANTSTIHCLVSLARLCPKLRTLHMKFADADLPSTLNFPYLSHPLQELHLVVRSLRDYVGLATLLDRIFPVLYKISVKGCFQDELDNWVPQMIRALQSVRKERRTVGSDPN